MVKDFLKEKNVEFEEVDVGQNQEKAKEMVAKSGQMGVPQIFIEKDGKEEIVVGFDTAKLTEILDLDK
jgi:glutaredoxin